MTFDTDWDIEEYKTKFECEEHWALKRDFLLAHKDKFPEERLICLAQLFVNIELLRCTYPREVMEQVSILAKEIGHDYKEKQKKLLQRTFVKASDAAIARARGEKRSHAQLAKSDAAVDDTVNQNTSKPKHKPIQWIPEDQSPVVTSSNVRVSSNTSENMINKYVKLVREDISSKDITVSPRIKAIRQKITCPLQVSASPQVKKYPQVRNSSQVQLPETLESLLDNANPLTSIVLVFHPYRNTTSAHYIMTLTNSLVFSKMSLEDEYFTVTSKTTCNLYTSTKLFLGTGQGIGKKEAKGIAAKNALEKLLKVCLCIKVLKVSSSDGEVSLDQLGITDSEEAPQKLSESNIGAKLMKMMGWSGGGLGKTGEGITEPIKESTVIGRSGLGLGKEEGVNQKFLSTVRRLILDYMNKEGVQDLVFSSDLSNIQRKAIHEQAARIGKKRLKTSSHGKGANRYLVVSWKMNNADVLQSVLDQGGKTEKYELFKPNTLTINDL